MLKNFILKQAMKSQLKGVPEAEQDKLIGLIEENPEFFENLAKDLQAGIKAGKDQQTVMAELMAKHRDGLSKLLQK